MMDAGEIKVSVLTTAYNHEPFIGQALESIVTQKTTFSFEVIVHDDASTDNTAKVIQAYAERYPEIVRPIFQAENQYSQGISPYDHMTPLARGEYIALCEGDDFWCDEHKLQKQVDYMDAHPECSYCFSNSYKVDLQSKIIEEQTPVKGESRAFSSREIIAQPATFLATASVIFRCNQVIEFPRELAIERVGDMTLRDYLMTRGNAYGFTERMACYRIMTPSSWTVQHLKDKQKHRDVYIRDVASYAAFYMKFDEYTGHLYHEELMQHLFRHVMEIVRATDDYGLMKKPPYKDYYKSLKNKKKIQLYLSYRFPGMMKQVYSIKDKLQKKG